MSETIELAAGATPEKTPATVAPIGASVAEHANLLAVSEVAVARARLLWEALARAGRLGETDEETLQRTFRDLVFVVEALAHAQHVGSVCVTAEAFALVARGTASLTVAARNLWRIGALARCDADGQTPGNKPLIAEAGEDGESIVRLYSARAFFEERRLAATVAALMRNVVDVPDPQDEKERSKRAVVVACANALSVISGGPGTGKTTAVMALLHKLLADRPEAVIVMAAPTGKAAGRMQEAVRNNAARLMKETGDANLSSLLTLRAQTVHRLLSTVNGDDVLPGPESPIDADILVIDESSMLDAGLAMRLFRAVDVERTKVILLGDRFQLAAVGPGSVFADLSDENGPLKRVITRLTFSHRFVAGKAVSNLAKAVNEGRSEADFACLANTGQRADDNCIVWHTEPVPEGKKLSEPLVVTVREMVDGLLEEIEAGASLARDAQAARALQRWSECGILCAHREGPMGVKAVNAFADLRMARRFEGNAWRPAIVRRNDPVIGVNNGDVGIIVPGADGEELYLPDAAGGGRFIPLALIEEWNPAFAITIHQSQGSEYFRVAVALPPDQDSPLATRELLYTAITRVKDKKAGDRTEFGRLDLFGSEEVLRQCVRRSTEREGGLQTRLQQHICPAQ